MELHPPLHLGVVTIEKGAFWLPSTKVANFTTYLCRKKDETMDHIVNACSKLE